MSEEKRYRRTLLQLEVDRQREKDGLPPIDWKNEDDKKKEQHYKNYNQKMKGDSGMEVSSSEKEDAEEAIKEIEKKLDGNRIPVDQLTELHKQITEVMTKELKTTAQEVVKEVTAKTIPQKITVSFKVNEKEMIDKVPDPHPSLARIVNLIKAGANVLLVGPAGCGKTMVSEQCAKVLGLEFGHICFSAGVSETWLYGRQLPTGFVEGEFSKLYREGGIFLGDEMDAADANLLLSINTALANNVLYNPISGQKIPRHKNFHFIAGANTFGKGQNSAYAGRNRLDAATLDRFILVAMDYLPEIEEKLCPVKELLDNIRELRSIVKSANGSDVISYRAFQKGMQMFHLGDNVKEIRNTLTLSWAKELRQKAGIKE